MNIINTARTMTYITTFATALLTGAPASAQNTGNVTGPVINAGDMAIEYRAAYDTDNEKFANRIHFQKAINDNFRWRIVAQTSETDDAFFDPDYLRAELLWQITQNGNAYQSAINFDARIRFNDRPESLAVLWANQYKFSDKITARLGIGAEKDIGNNRVRGFKISSEASLDYKIDTRFSIGADMYSGYGSTDNLNGLDDQNHQIGPYATIALDNKRKLYVGTLFGATDAAPDHTIRLFITQGF